MGLAEPRKRRKIGWDPNNVGWSASKDGYGRKILCAQGWTPGAYLGAKDAKQASHFSNASAAPISLTLKDDNLGVGAKGLADPMNSNFGLQSLQDLYGRLNGKDEETRKQDQSRLADMNLRLYADNKWGGLRFIKGGFLIGDKIQDEPAEDASSPSTVQAEDKEGGQQIEPLDGSGNNDSSQHLEGNITSNVSLENSWKEDEWEESRTQRECETMTDKQHSTRKSSRSKRDGKDLSKSKRASVKFTETPPPATTSAATSSDDRVDDPDRVDPDRVERKLRRKERRAAKQARHEAKQKKLSRTEAREELDGTQTNFTGEKSRDLKADNDMTESTSARAPSSDTNLANARFAVRQRFIKQKRMSSMDPKALQEILMIRS